MKTYSVLLAVVKLISVFCGIELYVKFNVMVDWSKSKGTFWFACVAVGLELTVKGTDPVPVNVVVEFTTTYKNPNWPDIPEVYKTWPAVIVCPVPLV